MTAIQRFAIHGTIMNPHSSGPYVRHEDHLAAMQGRCLAQIEEPAAPAAVAGVAWDKTRESLATLLLGLARRPFLDFDVACIALDAATAPGMPLAYMRGAPAAPALEAPAAPTIGPKLARIMGYREHYRTWGRQLSDATELVESHPSHWRIVAEAMDELAAALAAVPEAPNCTRCSGSGEDPEGFLTHGRGPDDHTVDGPCRSCDGTGAAPQAPAAPSALAAQVIENLLQLARIVNMAVEDWGETKEDNSLEVIFHKEEADKMEAILEFFDSLPDAPAEEGVIESGPLRAARVLRAMEAPAATEDPMDWTLPCDVTVGHGTIRKGCKLRTLVLRMQVLYNLAQEAELAAPAAPSGLPSGWVPCILTHDGQHPEEVAYGPQIMMDRLKNWLGRYFELLAQKVLDEPVHAEMLAALQAVAVDVVHVGAGENTISDAARAKVEAVLEKIGAPWPSAAAAPAAPAVDADPLGLRDVGEAFMQAIERNSDALKAVGWLGPMDCPSEIVVDLLNLLDEANTTSALGEWVATLEVDSGGGLDYETVPPCTLPPGCYPLYRAAQAAAKGF